MTEPLMPKATAVWLVDNTTLTFDQIADFCGLHSLEVQGIADGEVAVGIRGLDPVASGQLAREEIERCEGDPKSRLKMSQLSAKLPPRTRRARYTPVSKRQDRPNAIAWLIKNYPELSDAQVSKLLGTTKATITAVRERTHWNAQNIAPQDPLLLGICTEGELLEALRKAHKRQEREAAKAEKEARRLAKAKAELAAADAAPESAASDPPAPGASAPETTAPESVADESEASSTDTPPAGTDVFSRPAEEPGHGSTTEHGADLPEPVEPQVERG